MNMRRREFIVALAAFGLVGCKETTTSDTTETSITTYPAESLNTIETTGILQLREEEKLARDVYTTLYAKWGIETFNWIQKSEQFHMDQMALLVDRYDLVDPAKEAIGVFTDTKIQTLYETLVTKGEISKIDALEVGMTVEDLDIYDIDQVLSGNDNEDIASVFGILRFGSLNHMRRFYSDLSDLGGTYSPQYISQTTYDGILSL